MGSTSNLIRVTLILTALVFLFTIDDFLSLHDINKDYVSKSILEYLNIETSKELPSWTNTSLEWLSVEVSLVMRFFLILIILYLLVRLKNKIYTTNSVQITQESNF